MLATSFLTLEIMGICHEAHRIRLRGRGDLGERDPGRRRPGRGALAGRTGFALGAVGGLALGSAIAAGARPAYGYGYAPGPAYGYTPVYGGPAYGYAPAYGPDCYTVRRRMVDEFGDVYIRRVRVCD